jgi:hypothetical protein
MSIIDSHPVELTCPHCARKFSETIGKLHTNPKLTCPGCRGVIQIEADQLAAARKTVDKSLADFRAALSRIGK